MSISRLFSSNVASFLPEAQILNQINGSCCRLCHEDCAVLDARHGNVCLAFRGLGPRPDGDYFRGLGIGETDLDFLRSAISTSSRVLLPSFAGPILVFPEWMEQTGLLIAIRPDLPKDVGAEELLSLLHRIGREDFLPSPSVRAFAGMPSEHLPLCEQLRELFFYADAIFCAAPFRSGLLNGSVRIASFAGCQPESRFFSAQEELRTPTEQVFLAAFLLCVFLTLRQQTVCACAETFPVSCASGSDSPLQYSVRFLAAPHESIASKHSAPLPLVARELSFLNAPCFSEMQVSFSEDGVRFDTELSVSPTSNIYNTNAGKGKLVILLRTNRPWCDFR